MIKSTALLLLAALSCFAQSAVSVSHTTTTTTVVRGLPAFFGGNDYGPAQPLVSGAVLYYAVPFGCTVSGYDMTVDMGSAVIDVWDIADGPLLPTSVNSITAGDTPSVITGQHVWSTSVSTWKTAIAAHDGLGFYLKSVSGGTTQASLVLACK